MGLGKKALEQLHILADINLILEPEQFVLQNILPALKTLFSEQSSSREKEPFVIAL